VDTGLGARGCAGADDAEILHQTHVGARGGLEHVAGGARPEAQHRGAGAVACHPGPRGQSVVAVGHVPAAGGREVEGATAGGVERRDGVVDRGGRVGGAVTDGAVVPDIEHCRSSERGGGPAVQQVGVEPRPCAIDGEQLRQNLGCAVVDFGARLDPGQLGGRAGERSQRRQVGVERLHEGADVRCQQRGRGHQVVDRGGQGVVMRRMVVEGGGGVRLVGGDRTGRPAHPVPSFCGGQGRPLRRM
jgi:hypothetical protein